jgi:hypothetical protein
MHLSPEELLCVRDGKIEEMARGIGMDTRVITVSAARSDYTT